MSGYLLLILKNGSRFFILLLKTVYRHWNCFLSSVAKGEKDGHKLKLAKIDLKITKPFIMVSAP